MTVAFDTLKASRQLTAAGIDETQADALVSIFAEDIGASLVTKDDLAREIAPLRSEMRDLERRLTIRMGAMFGGGVTVLLTALGIITAIILTA